MGLGHPPSAFVWGGMSGLMVTFRGFNMGNGTNTKSRGGCRRLRFAVIAVPPVGKQVFLRVVAAITTIMRRMTPAVSMV